MALPPELRGWSAGPLPGVAKRSTKVGSAPRISRTLFGDAPAAPLPTRGARRAAARRRGGQPPAARRRGAGRLRGARARRARWTRSPGGPGSATRRCTGASRPATRSSPRPSRSAWPSTPARPRRRCGRPTRGPGSAATWRVCAMQAADHGVARRADDDLPERKGLEAQRDRAYRDFAELVRRAQAAGPLRADFVPEDVVLLLMANAGLVRGDGGGRPAGVEAVRVPRAGRVPRRARPPAPAAPGARRRCTAPCAGWSVPGPPDRAARPRAAPGTAGGTFAGRSGANSGAAGRRRCTRSADHPPEALEPPPSPAPTAGAAMRVPPARRSRSVHRRASTGVSARPGAGHDAREHDAGGGLTRIAPPNSPPPGDQKAGCQARQPAFSSGVRWYPRRDSNPRPFGS